VDPPEVNPKCPRHGYDEDGPSSDARFCEICGGLWAASQAWVTITVAGADGGPEDVLVPDHDPDERELLRGWEQRDVQRQNCPECRRCC